MKKMLLRGAMVTLALVTMSESANAQIRKPQLGIYAGASVPTGDFNEEAGIGWHAGALFKVRVTGSIDVRLDGAYNRFSTQVIDIETARVESESQVTFGALNAELNLGPDSAAYPGDNSISPYLTGGPGIYRSSFEATCTGACTNDEASGSESKFGFNIGAGANVPFRGIPLFVEFRYHRFGTTLPISQLSGNATMITGSIGVKLR